MIKSKKKKLNVKNHNNNNTESKSSSSNSSRSSSRSRGVNLNNSINNSHNNNNNNSSDTINIRKYEIIFNEKQLANEFGGGEVSSDEQLFTKTALFHTPTSILTKLDLKQLFQPSIFEAFPRHSQLKLIKLLPECDRQLDSHGSFK